MAPTKSEQSIFYEITSYTQSHNDPAFIHQYVVDAFAAQYADENTKPITLTFALIGLYLHLEKNFTGKEVQQAHIKLAKHRKKWPKFPLPKCRGEITVFNVIEAPEGLERDSIIKDWCESVWKAYGESHEEVAKLVNNELYCRKNKRKNISFDHKSG